MLEEYDIEMLDVPFPESIDGKALEEDLKQFSPEGYIAVKRFLSRQEYKKQEEA